MGLFGSLLSAPFKIVGGITEVVGESTGLEKLTNIISKPLDTLGDTLEDIDQD